MPPVAAALAAFLVTDLAIGATTAAIIASVVVNLAIAVAVTGLSMLLAPGQPKPPSPHASRQNFRNPVSPRVRAYGRVKLGGAIVFLKLHEVVFQGETRNALYVVIAQAQGQWDWHEEFYLGDGKVVLDGDTVVQPTNFAYLGYDWVRLSYRLGSNTQSAYSLLTGAFPGQWTSDFTGYGIPSLALRFQSPEPENFTKVYPSGLPVMSSVARAARVWDPRVGTQHANNPISWRWSSNGIIVLLDAIWNADGLGLPFDLVEAGIDVWELEADYCDTWRALKNGGSEPWFRLCGAYSLTDPVKSWLPKMLDPMDARIALRSDGAVVPSVGRWHEPELSISDDDIVSYTSLARGRAKGDIKNRFEATFVSSDYAFIQQQADTLLNEDSIDVDGEQSTTLDLDWAPSHAQARVRMKIEAARQDPDAWNGTVVTKAIGLKFLTSSSDGTPKRFVHFTISELGIDDDFEVSGFSFDVLSGNCTFNILQMSSDAFDWDADEDEGVAPEFPVNQAANGVENPNNLAISVSGGVITATFDAPLDSGLSFNLDYRPTGDATGDDQASWTELTHVSHGGHTGTLGDGRYDVRCRLKDTGGTTTLYSDPRVIRGIKVGTGARVVVLAAPSSFNVVDCGGRTVLVTLTAVSDVNARGVVIWASPHSSDGFVKAVPIADFALQAGDALREFVEVDFTGDYNFWATTTRVTGADSVETGPIEVVVTGGSFVDPAPVPAAPGNVAATAEPNSTLSITWDAVVGYGTITNYAVYVIEGTGGIEAASPATNTGGTSASVSGLEIDTDYSIYIVATNANGDSVPSDEIVATTLAVRSLLSKIVLSSPYTLDDEDSWVDIANGTGAALEIRMCAHPRTAQGVLLTDGGNNAGNYNWTIKDNAGTTTIDTVDINGGWSQAGYKSSEWQIGKTV